MIRLARPIERTLPAYGSRRYSVRSRRPCLSSRVECRHYRTGEAIGKSGDEGIDGIIAEDRLGLEMVYLQAKQWEGTVGRPEIQKFVGALHGKRARKGVFITTGTFSAEATEYVRNIYPRVALVDGTQLAQLMVDFNVGVALDRAYEIKKIDSDYFEEDG